LVVDESNAILGHAPGSPTGGRIVGVQEQRQGNRHGVHRSAAFPHAGSATFGGWLRPLDWEKSLQASLPHARPRSNNHLLPVEQALAFRHGLLCEARQLPHVACLRRDPLVPPLLGIKRIASRSALSPGHRFQSLVTSLPAATHRPLAVWPYDNGRADCENVLKELRTGFALPTLGLETCRASQGALSLATLTYNLTVLFQRHRGWWRCLWEKIRSPLPNCHAVENRPVFSGQAR
jgi:hypothetical protein